MEKSHIMKKKITFIAVLVSIFLGFLSCEAKIDTSVWLKNLDDGKKAAKSEDKIIFFFISDDEEDEKSAKLKEKIFNTDEFLENYTEKFVLVNIDYSSSRAENDSENLSRDIKIFEHYNAQEFPSFFILSSEGFVISHLAFDEQDDLDSAKLIFNAEEEKIKEFREKLAKIKKGSKEEKLSAINEIYDETETQDSYHLRPLSELYVSLDKKNESGNYLKHAINIAYANAEDYILNYETEKGAKEFVKLANDKNLTDDDKQMAFFTAAQLLIQSDSQDLETVIDYLNKAYNFSPESNNGENIKRAIDYVQSLIDGEDDEISESESVDTSVPSPESEQ